MFHLKPFLLFCSPYKIITPLALSLLFLSIIFSSVTFAASSENVKQLYEAAEQSFSAEDYEGTIPLLKEALNENPSDISSRYLLGLTHLRMGAVVDAEDELKRARRGGIDENLIAVPLAKCYLAQGKYLQLFDDIQATGKPKEVAADLYNIFGEAYIELHELEKADRAFEEAEYLIPDMLDTFLGRARMHLFQNEINIAEDMINTAVVIDEDNANAWFIKGDIQRIQRNFTSAIEYLDKAIEIDPYHVPARLARAASLIELDKDEIAKVDLRHVRKYFPNEPKAGYLYALILARNDKIREAQAVLIRLRISLLVLGDGYTQNHAPSLLISAVVNHAQKNYDDSYAQLIRYIELVPHDAGARTLLASIMLKRGAAQDIITTLKPLLVKDIDDPQIYALLGQAYTLLKQFTKATEMFDKAVKLSPDLAELRMHLGLSRLAIGQKKSGIADLQAALLMDPSKTKPGIMLGIVYLKNGRFKDAIATADGIIKRQPENPTGYNLLGAVYMSNHEEKLARYYFNESLSRDNTFLPAQINLSKLEEIQGNRDAAMRILTKILTDHQQNLYAMDELSKFYQADGDLDKAIELLEKYRAHEANSIPQQIRLALLYVRQGKSEYGIQLAQELETRHSSDMSVLELLGKLSLLLDKRDQAVLIFKRMSRFAGYDKKELFGIAQQQLAADDLEGAKWTLQKSIVEDEDFFPGLAASIQLDIRLGNHERAMELARAYQQRNPQDENAYLLIGDVQMAMGEWTQAVQSFQQGLKIQQKSKLAIRWYEANIKAGFEDKAQKYIENWAEKYPDDLDVQRALASHFLKNRQNKRSIEIHESLLKKLPEDPEVLNNLAILYLRNGDDERARNFAQLAYQYAPHEAATLDTFGWSEILYGNLNEGLKLLREAAVRTSREPVVQYHLAVVLDQLNRKREALRTVKKALRLKKPFDERKEAEVLAKKLGKSRRPVLKRPVE